VFLTSDSDPELVAFARQENKRVKVVSVNGCSKVTAEGVLAIAKDCTELQEFQAANVEKAGAAAFAELITLRSGSLVLLNLSGCKLGAEGAQLVVNALKSRYLRMSIIHANSFPMFLCLYFFCLFCCMGLPVGLGAFPHVMMRLKKRDL
jgi:hypothetical protein